VKDASSQKCEQLVTMVVLVLATWGSQPQIALFQFLWTFQGTKARKASVTAVETEAENPISTLSLVSTDQS
jgi:hypothetical protein